jgi:hypothetical protein
MRLGALTLPMLLLGHAEMPAVAPSEAALQRLGICPETCHSDDDCCIGQVCDFAGVTAARLSRCMPDSSD